MEKYATYKANELHSLLMEIYYGIRESVRIAALIHINGRKSNENHNPYHFQHLVENSNETIIKFKEFYPVSDKLRYCFDPIKMEEFEHEAENFLNSDIF